MKLKLSDRARDVIATVAPTLGVALGGPLGGLAGQVLGSLLGGGSAGDIEKALIEQKPETMLALRKAEQEFVLKLEELGVERDRIEMADRSSARDLAKVNMKPQMLISALFIGGYFSIILMLITGVASLEGDDGGNLNLLLGVLTAGIPTILAFWFGSTAGGAQKNALLAASRPADSVR